MSAPSRLWSWSRSAWRTASSSAMTPWPDDSPSGTIRMTMAPSTWRIHGGISVLTIRESASRLGWQTRFGGLASIRERSHRKQRSSPAGRASPTDSGPPIALRRSTLGDALEIGRFLRDVSDVRTVGHEESATGQFAELLLVPARNFAVVTLSNAHPADTRLTKRSSGERAKRPLASSSGMPNRSRMTRDEPGRSRADMRTMPGSLSSVRTEPG